MQPKKRVSIFQELYREVDGTNVRVRVPSNDAPKYRGRKGYPAIFICPYQHEISVHNLFPTIHISDNEAIHISEILS